MMVATSTKLTYEDYLEMPDDGKRYEIIDGELYVNPAPVPRHQLIVGNLIVAFQLHFRQRGGGRAYPAPVDVLLGTGTVVQPDLVVVTSANPIVQERNISGAPDITIEVLSKGTRRMDEISKRKLYERAGVSEYWIVDPELETVKIYRRAGGAFERAAEISTETGGSIATPILPGFTLDVQDVFRN